MFRLVSCRFCYEISNSYTPHNAQNVKVESKFIYTNLRGINFTIRSNSFQFEFTTKRICL